jgi:hypothetical protein
MQQPLIFQYVKNKCNELNSQNCINKWNMALLEFLNLKRLSLTPQLDEGQK